MITKIYFRVIRVSTEQDLEIFQRFVYEKYCFREGYLKPEDYPSGKVTDEFDQHSSHFLLYAPDSDNLAGTFRIVPHSKEHGLPIQKVFDLPNIDPRNFCEITRVISDKYKNSIGASSDSGKSVIFEAVRYTVVFCKQNNLKGWISMVDLRAFIKTNLIFKNTLIPLSPPIFYEGGWTMPAALEISKFFSALKEHDPQLLQCFED